MGESLPAAGYYVDSTLKELFNDTLDQLISDLGRSVRLYFEPSASGCSNCGLGPDGGSNGIYNAANPYPVGQYKRAFPNGAVCPVCRGTHNIYTEQYATYTALINRKPKNLDYTKLNINPENVYSTKMVMAAFEDIKRTKKALIDGEWCVRLQDPVKTGLKDLKYCKCFWKKID